MKRERERERERRRKEVQCVFFQNGKIDISFGTVGSEGRKGRRRRGKEANAHGKTVTARVENISIDVV